MEIFVDEEYGHRYYLWIVGMTDDQLTLFWESLEDINSCRVELKEILPGLLIQLEESSKAYYDALYKCVWYCHVHMNDDSYLYHKVGKSTFWHKGVNNEK